MTTEKPKPAPRDTRTKAELAQLAERSQARADDHYQKLQAVMASREETAKERTELRERLDDLKARLVFAEARNRWLDGYLARVHEDDVVREELIATGNPEDATLVPKRKPAPPPSADPRDHVRPSGDRVYRETHDFAEVSERRRPLHWVAY